MAETISSFETGGVEYPIVGMRETSAAWYTTLDEDNVLMLKNLEINSEKTMELYSKIDGEETFHLTSTYLDRFKTSKMVVLSLVVDFSENGGDQETILHKEVINRKYVNLESGFSEIEGTVLLQYAVLDGSSYLNERVWLKLSNNFHQAIYDATQNYNYGVLKRPVVQISFYD